MARSALLIKRAVSWVERRALLLLLPLPLLQNSLFPAWLGTERVTGQGVYWNTVFSSAASAVQLQYSRNIVLLCGGAPRPAPFSFYTRRPPTSHYFTPCLSPRLSQCVSVARPRRRRRSRLLAFTGAGTERVKKEQSRRRRRRR